MQTESLFQTLAQLPEPVLTAYLNTSGSDASLHSPARTPLARFLRETETMRRTLSHHDAKQFDRQTNRVRRFLEERHPAEKAVVIFAGAKTWKIVPLQIPVCNEVHWGKPKIDPLLPLLNGHRRYGVAVLDHKAARYFEFAYGELTLLGTKPFEIDHSQWKRMEQGRVAIDRVQNSRGPVRDLYEHRIEAQFQRLCHEVGEETVALCKRKELDGVFLVGPDRLIQAVKEKMPPSLAGSIVLVQENFGRSSPRQLQSRFEALFSQYEHEQQLSAVKSLQASDAAAVTNPDEVLAQLQNGRIRTLVVARDLEIRLRQCPQCGFATSAADRTCPDCGVVRQEITLGELLARILTRASVKFEFVDGEAAQLLRQTGGLAGWLHTGHAKAAS